MTGFVVQGLSLSHTHTRDTYVLWLYPKSPYTLIHYSLH